MTAAAVAAPVRLARIATPDAVVDRRADGTTYVRSCQPLGSYPATLTLRPVGEKARYTAKRSSSEPQRKE